MKNRNILIPPAAPLLLHVCCSVCSCEAIEAILYSKINFAIYFYNPNIFPKSEYLKRKADVLKLIKKHKLKFYDADYNHVDWLNKIKGHEQEPERGKRCQICYALRLKKAAQFAHQNKYKAFTSCLGISRWKPFEVITKIGLETAREFPGLVYWDYNWRKNGGSERMYKIAKANELYFQKYCGCEMTMSI
ncbi:epoxyqueuosine reductase QueH [Candidatus Margulisiibacteriota bacterium]